jgi:hypothetical protein
VTFDVMLSGFYKDLRWRQAERLHSQPPATGALRGWPHGARPEGVGCNALSDRCIK